MRDESCPADELTGRTAARAAAGLALIVAGAVTGGTGGLVLALIGLVPLAAGAAGVCVAAPVLNAPFRAR